MQRATPARPVVGAARGLAIHGHELRPGVAQVLDPRREAVGEQIAVERAHDVAQRIVAGDAARVGQKAFQERPVHHAPAAGFYEVLGPRQSAAQHQGQDFGQGIDHLPRLPRVRQRREVIQQRPTRRDRHARLQTRGGQPTPHRAAAGQTQTSSPAFKRLPWVVQLR